MHFQTTFCKKGGWARDCHPPCDRLCRYTYIPIVYVHYVLNVHCHFRPFWWIFFVVGRENCIWRKKISGENVSDQCIWAFNVIYGNCPFCNKTEFICDLAGNNNIFWPKDYFLIMAIHLTLGHGCVWVTVTSVCDSNSAGELLSTRLGDISANDKLKY